MLLRAGCVFVLLWILWPLGYLALDIFRLLIHWQLNLSHSVLLHLRLQSLLVYGSYSLSNISFQVYGEDRRVWVVRVE
jgi:hypothetical protein